MKFLIFVFVMLGFATTCVAQPSQLNEAFGLYQTGKYTEAKKALLKYREIKKFDEGAIYLQAASDVHLKNYQSAINLLDTMLLIPRLSKSYINQARVQLAKCYSALDDKEKALNELEFIANNDARFGGLLRDTIFNSIAGDERFLRVKEKMAANQEPCLYDPRYQKLKFFVGTWEVFIGDKFDSKAAVDTVTVGPGGCSINENFKWLNGNYAGKSMIFFDPGAQKYRMAWAGTNADIRNFEEVSFEENKMVLLAITNSDSNELIHRRMTLTFNPAEGSVHQYIENSKDFGKTWEVAFDAMFRKAK